MIAAFKQEKLMVIERKHTLQVLKIQTYSRENALPLYPTRVLYITECLFSSLPMAAPVAAPWYIFWALHLTWFQCAVLPVSTEQPQSRVATIIAD
jgi:hypothetical protein